MKNKTFVEKLSETEEVTWKRFLELTITFYVTIKWKITLKK